MVNLRQPPIHNNDANQLAVVSLKQTQFLYLTGTIIYNNIH